MYGSLNYVISLMLVDSAVMVLAGYHDMKRIEFSILAIPPLLAVPAFLYYVFWNMPLFPLLAILINGIFVSLIVLGYVGLMDIVVSVRVPLILPLLFWFGPTVILWFGIGSLLAYIYFYYRYVKPILCPGASITGITTRVKKEAIALNYVMPKGVAMDIDPEKLAKIKKKIMMSTDNCVEAVVGFPYIFVFSLGYALALISVSVPSL